MRFIIYCLLIISVFLTSNSYAYTIVNHGISLDEYLVKIREQNGARFLKKRQTWEKIIRLYCEVFRLRYILDANDKCIQRLKQHASDIDNMYDKGLLPLVEVMRIKTWLRDKEIEQKDYELQLNEAESAVNKFINKPQKDDFFAEPLGDVLAVYDSFEQWLNINSINSGLVEGEYESVNASQLFTSDDKRYLYSIFERLQSLKEQIDMIKVSVNDTEKILEYQSERFKNMLSGSGDVVEASFLLRDRTIKYYSLLSEYIYNEHRANYYFSASDGGS